MLKLNRRQFLQSSCAALAVVGVPVLAYSGLERSNYRLNNFNSFAGFETDGLEPRIRLVEDVQIRGYRSTEFDRDFEIGQILTKEDVDSVSPYPYDASQPGWFEMLIEQGLAEYV